MASAGDDPPPPRLLSIPKEGERILAPTRRPDGTLRKPIRIRAGYVPQDEVAIYQSKGVLVSLSSTLWRGGMQLRKASQPEVPPGYDPALAEKPKTKSAKRNERKKEKRHQAALEKEKTLDTEQAEVIKTEPVPSAESIAQGEESVELVTDQISRISVSATPVVVSPSTDTVEIPKAESSDTLSVCFKMCKYLIRLAEAQLQGDQQSMKPEQVEKMRKIEGWREELKLLEDRKCSWVFSYVGCTIFSNCGCAEPTPKPVAFG
ncbi:Mago binding [Musa troglodytarum]|uniref:Mago binding n=1 Tax=Musa troglodytarum TaxID=320322 RepID=A0A9E7ENK4_9LILI|nr:Mago binding [Musa troglodytarum]